MEELNLSQMDEAYSLFEKAFIPAELRYYQSFYEMFKNGNFSLYGIYENNSLVGVISTWEFEDFIFLENFAVDASLRGKGIGSTLLNQIQEKFNKTLVLEVEEAADEICKRRIEFYKRNHFLLTPYSYIQPALRKNQPSVCLQLMVYPNLFDEKRFLMMKEKIFKRVYQ